jgi:hypothetical protein
VAVTTVTPTSTAVEDITGLSEITLTKTYTPVEIQTKLIFLVDHPKDVVSANEVHNGKVLAPSLKEANRIESLKHSQVLLKNNSSVAALLAIGLNS